MSNVDDIWYEQFNLGNTSVSKSIQKECYQNPYFEDFIKGAFVRHSREQRYNENDRTKPIIAYYNIPERCCLGDGYGRIRIATFPKDRCSYATFEYEEI